MYLDIRKRIIIFAPIMRKVYSYNSCNWSFSKTSRAVMCKI